MEGVPASPQHAPAAADPAAAAPEPRAVETCRERAGAWPRREAESARGPRLLTHAPRPIPRTSAGSSAAAAGPARPPARPPAPRVPRLPDTRQAPYPRGAGPRGALPRMSVPAGSAPRAQGPEHRAGASPLSRLLFLSLCSLAGLLVLSLARAFARSHTTQLTLPALHSAAAAAAAAAAARIYRMSRQRDVDAHCPASPGRPIRVAGCLKGQCRDESVRVGPARRRWPPRLPRGRFCLGCGCASRRAPKA